MSKPLLRDRQPHPEPFYMRSALLAWLVRIYRGLVWRGHLLRHWLTGWWSLLFIGAQVLVLSCTPSSYTRQGARRVAAQLYRATVPGLRSFTLMMAIFNVVITRIMVSTASGYGLSGFALDAVVRTLVLELIPLTAAAFVAVQYSVPSGNELHKLRRNRDAILIHKSLAERRRAANDLLTKEVLPRVLGGTFSVLFLALLSGLISLVIAYLIVYGFNVWGFAPYSRVVGQMFNPATSLLFVVKTLLFALIVAVLPLGAAMQNHPAKISRTHIELQALVRMLTLLLCVEVLSLMGNYY